MHELVTMLVKGLVDQPEQVTVKTIEGERSIIFEVRVAGDDLGKVIGKGGRIANALRTIVRAAGTKERKSIWMDINKLGEPSSSSPEEWYRGFDRQTIRRDLRRRHRAVERGVESRTPGGDRHDPAAH